MTKVKDYIDVYFPGLILRSSLFYQWDTAIHFRLAKGFSPFKIGSDELNNMYFKQVYQQALSLFNDIFTKNDRMFFVTNVYHYKNNIRKSQKKLKLYHHFIKNKAVRYQLKQETFPYLFLDEEDVADCITVQFSLACCKQDIRYPLLIKAICNQDFPPLKPRLQHPDGLYPPHIFFINITKNIILYIYDDRGCEVIANDTETIRPIYEKYFDRVDEYSRKELE